VAYEKTGSEYGSAPRLGKRFGIYRPRANESLGDDRYFRRKAMTSERNFLHSTQINDALQSLKSMLDPIAGNRGNIYRM
jgi:hypothetical protein